MPGDAADARGRPDLGAAGAGPHDGGSRSDWRACRRAIATKSRRGGLVGDRAECRGIAAHVPASAACEFDAAAGSLCFEIDTRKFPDREGYSVTRFRAVMI